MKQNVLALSIASALSFIAADQARAAAFALYEQGVSGLGNAYAGAAAVAEDSTTVWWNPAGMARLAKGKHFAIAAAVITPSTEFSNSGSVPPLGRPLGSDGGDAGDTAIVPTAFFSMDFGPQWNFGVALTVPFGLKTEYSPDWIGRFAKQPTTSDSPDGSRRSSRVNRSSGRPHLPDDSAGWMETMCCSSERAGEWCACHSI